jgi:CheY-like chemotaxis protein
MIGIVEMHGGLIAANSDGEGHGTEFYFDIPLHKQAKYSKSGKLRASMIALESEGLEDIMEEGAEALRQFEAEQDEEQQSPTVKNKHVEIPAEKNSTPSVVSKPPSIPIPDKLDTSANVSWWTLLQRIFTFGRSSKIHTNGTEIENPSPSSSTHRSRETTVHSMTKNFLNYPVKLLTRRLTRPDVHSPDDISGGNDNENDNENESLSTVTFLKVPKEEEADIENQNGLGRTYNSQNHLIEGNMVYCPENNRLEDYEIVEENPERTSSEISTDLPKNTSSGSKNVTINLKVERIPTEDEIEHPSTAPHTPPTSNMMNKTPSKIVQPKFEPGIASPKLPTEEKEEAKPAVVINEFNLLLNSSPVTSPSPQRKRAISESPQPTYRRINNNNNNNDGLSSPPNGVSDEFKRFRSQTCVEAKENHSDSSHLQNGQSKRTWDSGLNILLVDDADSNRKMCRRFLTTQRHNVLEAKDGLDCLRVYDESLKNNLVFDLILMDDNMPNLLGYEAAKRLRDRGYTGVIVGVTGDIYPENIERFTKNGANEVLGKPLNVTKLRERFCQLAP